jgi:hypothetical protein
MKFYHTDTGFRAAGDDGATVCVVNAKVPAVPAKPPGHGVPAQKAVPERVRSQREWTFEFVGRPITVVELADLVASLPGAEKAADAERAAEKK